jgi:hypothetical protein
MRRADDVGQVFEMNFVYVRNFIYITDHNDRRVGNAFEPTKYTLALKFLAGPWALIFGRLVGPDDNVLNLMKPFSVSVFILLKIKRLGTTHMIHFGFDKYETVNIPVENLETEF